jgi:hypothetical protein
MPIDDVPHLKPPATFDHNPTKFVVERVLSPAEVQLICWAQTKYFGSTAATPPVPGSVYFGCTRMNSVRCEIVRVDDERIRRHENAHCNGWVHQ